MDNKKIVHGATNTPATSQTKVVLGNREYKLVHLPYKDYVAFICLVEPAVKSLFSAGVSLDALELDNASSFVRPILDVLPELVHLSLKQVDPKITIDDITKYATSPVQLAYIVIAQIQHNNMIQEFADFFKQMAVLIPNQKV